MCLKFNFLNHFRKKLEYSSVRPVVTSAPSVKTPAWAAHDHRSAALSLRQVVTRWRCAGKFESSQQCFMLEEFNISKVIKNEWIERMLLKMRRKKWLKISKKNCQASNIQKMAELDRFRMRDALFIIGSIITFIADQATGGSSLSFRSVSLLPGNNLNISGAAVRNHRK